MVIEVVLEAAALLLMSASMELHHAIAYHNSGQDWVQV